MSKRVVGARVLTALAAVAGLAVLSACQEESEPSTPQERLVTALDNFLADNVGYYTLSVPEGASSSSDIGYYRVAPDANATLRTVDTEDGDEVTVRYLRTVDDTWVLVPGSEKADVRSSCWVHGELENAAAAAGVDPRAVFDVTTNSPAVEVVLSLRDGRVEDGDLVADANLRELSSALGPGAAKDLGLSKSRVDIPVVVRVQDERIVGWSVSVADIAAASPDGDVLEAEDGAMIEATFADPETDVDFSAPDEANTVDDDDDAETFGAFLARCS